MANVFGIGEYKAKEYGKPFIEAIIQYGTETADLPFPEAATIIKSPSEPSSYMEKQKQLHANAYAKWDDEEDRKLTNYFNQGLSTSQIASLMNRNTGGISSRIKKLGLERDDESKAGSATSQENKSKMEEYRKELDKLAAMRAEIDRKIEELQAQMEDK